MPAASLELRFALLSIRHTEMDAVVDGAWLRNAEISRPRPAAQTDDLVYETSLRQLDELCRSERHVRLYMYQTGLETAVVGFYRALANHLLGTRARSRSSPCTTRSLARTPGRRITGTAVTPVVTDSSPLPEGDPVDDVPADRHARKRGPSASHMRAFMCKDCQREVEHLEEQLAGLEQRRRQQAGDQERPR